MKSSNIIKLNQIIAIVKNELNNDELRSYIINSIKNIRSSSHRVEEEENAIRLFNKKTKDALEISFYPSITDFSTVNVRFKNSETLTAMEKIYTTDGDTSCLLQSKTKVRESDYTLISKTSQKDYLNGVLTHELVGVITTPAHMIGPVDYTVTEIHIKDAQIAIIETKKYKNKSLVSTKYKTAMYYKGPDFERGISRVGDCYYNVTPITEEELESLQNGKDNDYGSHKRIAAK